MNDIYDPTKTTEGIIKLKLLVDEVIQDLKHSLRGDIWDSDKEEYINDKNKEAMLNDKGVNAILSIVYPMVSRIISLGFIDEKIVYSITLETGLATTEVLFVKADVFEADLSYFDVIVNTVTSTTFCTLSRAIGGFQQKIDKDIIKIHETQSVQDTSKKSGLLNKFYNSNRGGNI